MSENNVFLGQQAAEIIAHGTKEQIDKNRINYQLTDDNAGILISGGFGGNTQNDSLTNGIDVNNLITTIPAAAEQTYTATEDCFILTYCVAGSDKSVVIYLDEVLVASTYSNSSIISITQTIFVAKGQTVKVVRNLSNFDREIYVYGIKDKEDKLKCYTYDTKEHAVGTWIDGSPIYEKTFVFDGTNETETIDARALNIKDLIDSKTSCLIEIDGALIPEIATDTDSHVYSGKDGFWNGYSHYAAHLFNGYQGTEAGSWGVNGVSDASEHYVVYQFDYPVVPKKCSIQNYTAYTTNGTFQFQFSKDGENWTTLGDIVDCKTYTNAGELVNYEFLNEEEYSYFRLFVTGSLSQVNSFICVDSVQVYGKAKIRASLHDNVYLGFDKLIISGNQKMVKYATIQYTKN